jgi:phosphoribosylanthranilate isomerase
MTSSLNRLVMLGCIILAASIPLAYLNMTWAQANRDEDLVAETLLSILDEVDDRVLEAFEQLGTNGISVPEEARTSYQYGLVLANEAIKLFKDGNSREASEKATEALQEFKKALMVAQEALQEEPSGTEITAEKALILRDSLSRIWEHMRRLENMAELVAAEGYDSTIMGVTIKETKRILEEATNKLETGDLDGTANDLDIARVLVLESEEQLRRLTEDMKADRIQAYMTETEKRISDLKEEVDSLSNQLPTQIKDASLTALNEAEDSIQNAKDLLEKEMINESIDELTEAKEKEEEAINLISSAVTSLDALQNPVNATASAANINKTIEP